ncbi:MAG: DNA methyltransferase [Chloroflexota bacterium]
MTEQQASLSSPPTLKEQLRLFAFNGRNQSERPHSFEPQMSKRERLAALLEGELDFHGTDSGYASHNLHAFAAKFPPQLPRAFIRGLTRPGQVVLDPMMGSGTTIVEAILEGRCGIGLDLDPLAVQLGQVKTTPLDMDAVRLAGLEVAARAYDLITNNVALVAQNLAQRFEQETRAFIDYWFLPNTQLELMALVLALEGVEGPPIKRFLQLTFSSVIVTKSGGVSRARDLAHSRPHRVEDKVPRNALEQFSTRFGKNLASLAEIRRIEAAGMVTNADTRSMPLADEVVDLIVTSPPYANAIDYMRAHKFSLVWLGASVNSLSEVRSQYIGSERVGDSLLGKTPLPDRAEEIIGSLAALDRKKADILRKYFVEMRMTLAEMVRVLRKDGAAIVVVGTSTMRGLDVQTHTCLADIGASLGFEVVGVVERNLDRNKRMMPARFGKQKGSNIEHRMHEEYVIGFYKGE